MNPCPVVMWMWCVLITEPGSLPDPVPALRHRGLSKPGTRKELSKRASGAVTTPGSVPVNSELSCFIKLLSSGGRFSRFSSVLYQWAYIKFVWKEGWCTVHRREQSLLQPVADPTCHSKLGILSGNSVSMQSLHCERPVFKHFSNLFSTWFFKDQSQPNPVERHELINFILWISFKEFRRYYQLRLYPYFPCTAVQQLNLKYPALFCCWDCSEIFL